MANPLVARSRKPLKRAPSSCAPLKSMPSAIRTPTAASARHFQVIYVSGWAPHESQQQQRKPGNGQGAAC